MPSGSRTLVECVPNISEGRRREVVDEVVDTVAGSPNVRVLHIDMGADANRTVITFAGSGDAVLEAGFRLIWATSRLIDMTIQRGTHPRIGATDVFPFVPLGTTSLEECVTLARTLGERVGRELEVPVFLYEAAASRPERHRLPDIRRGEFEGLHAKLADPLWAPDFGPATPHPTAGALVIGARPFLIAYNVNLDTDDVSIAKQIAARIRESGSKTVDAEGHLADEPRRLASCRAIGWSCESFGRVQVSMNLTNFSLTGLYEAFNACAFHASLLGTKATGSELVGLVPKQALVDAGRACLKAGAKEHDDQQLMAAAVDYLGLSELTPFVVKDRVVEYCLEGGSDR